MTRINVYRYDDLDGKTLDGHFDIDRAEKFEEGTRWDGNNHVSLHVGDKFDHQTLYRTAKGRWVLNNWSQWQGREETYEFITDDQAREWLLIAKEDAAVEKYLGEIEEERGPGRPAVGAVLNVRFPDDVRARLDERAAGEGVAVAEMVRRLVTAGLS